MDTITEQIELGNARSAESHLWPKSLPILLSKLKKGKNEPIYAPG